MAKKFLTDINIAAGVYDSSGDIGNSGQVLSSTGSGVNWINATSSASIIYQDGFTGDGSTTAFTLANSIDNENKTQVYIDGVYQHKDTFSLSGTTLTFSTAPPNTTDIEVISFSSVSAADDILYDEDFSSAGLMTTNGSGVYSITTNNSSNWNTAHTYSQVGHLPLAGGAITGAITTNSTFDGRDVSVDGTKLDGIEAGATADQTDAEIRTAVEAATDSNVFTDADHTKLNAIEASATADQTAAEIRVLVEAATDSNVFTDADHTKLNAIEASADVTDTANVTAAGALMDSEVTNLADVKAFDTTDYATAAQGTLADSAQQPPSEGAFANGDKTKLDGIAAGAEVNVQSDWNSASGDNLILNKPSIPSITGLATETYVDTAVSDLVDSSPATLNTLNELAVALGNDPNFATTTATSIGTKLPLAGGTLTGFIQLGANELRFDQSGTRSWAISASGGNLNINSGDSAGNVAISSGLTVADNATFTGTVTAPNFVLTGTDGFNLPSGGFLDWANGDARIVEGLVNNYSLSFQTYDGSAVSTALRLDGNNNATFEGTITASGYNDSNWNTAYGWGNHASGGYAADNAVVKLTGNQSIDGIKTFIGTHLSLNTAANSWKYFRLQSGTSVLWDIGTNENDDSSSLQFRPAGGPTNRVTISQAGVIAAPRASINASAGYPLQTSSSQRYNIQIRNTNNTVNASYGWWWGTDTNFDMFFHADGASDRFTLTRQGEATAFASMSAPIYYDRNDTSYYLNPASTGTSLNIAGGISTNVANGNVIIKHTVSEANSWLFQENAANWGLFWLNESANGTAFGSYTTVGAEFIGFRNGSNTNFKNPSAWTGIASGAYAGWLLSNYSGYFWTASTQYSETDMRAPIFYDSANTAYYTDPASTGTSLNVRGEISNPSIWINDGDNTGNYNENIRLFDPAAGHPSVIAFGATGTSGSPATSILGYSDRLESRFADAWQLRVKSGYVQASGDFRAPIFYDSNDTSWYLNPASTSLLNRVEINDDLDVRAQVGTWITSDVMGDAIGWNSSYGVYIGSNVGGTHYLRGNGTFTTGGSTHNLWHEGNDTTFVRYRSSLTSQDWNLYIDGTEAGYNGVLNHSGSNRPPAYTYGIALNLAVSGQGKAQIYFPETGSSSNGIYVRTGWSSSYRDWRSIALHNVNPQTGGALYASGFYDSGNTGFYINADSTSNLYNLELSGAKHTYLYITPGNGYEAMVRFNGGSGNTWYAGKRTSTQLLGSTDAFHFYSQTSGQTVGGYDTGGHHYTVGSSRGPIFYDQNDTSYYTDPNSTSRINALTTNSLQVGSATIGLVVTPSWTNANADQWPYITWHRDTANSWDEGLIKNSSSRGFFGKGGWGIHMDSTRAFHVFSSGWTSNFGVEHGGSCRAAGDLRAPVFYDLNNTAYYTNPASTSVINGLTMAGALQTAGSHTVGSSGTANIYMGGTSGNYFRFHTNNSHTYFDGNVGDIHWRQGASTRFTFYMTSANMTINGSLTQNSDERVKENIVEIPNAIDKVKAMKGVYYNRTDFNTGVTKVGVLAQEVEAVLPELIVEAPDSGLKSVAYGELTAVLINAIKELEARVQELENN